MAVVKTDNEGFLIKEASSEKIGEKYQEILNEIIKSCKEHLGDKLISVYVGGSVALGTAVENKSDVDTYEIVSLSKEEIEKADKEWVIDEEKRINELFPFQRGVEMHLTPQDNVSEGRKFQMKVLTTKVFGKDFDSELPKYKLDRETMGKIRRNVRKDVDIARKELTETNDQTEIGKICTWIAKRLIRNTGMLCMWKGDYFTMDIPSLVEIIISNYPEKKVEVEKLFEYTKTPSTDKHDTLNLLDTFGSWLVEEDQIVFNIDA